jgi:hypothetical protein
MGISHWEMTVKNCAVSSTTVQLRTGPQHHVFAKLFAQPLPLFPVGACGGDAAPQTG